MESEGLQVKPFDFIRRVDPAHFLNLIQQEHPQTIALVLSYLEPNKASIILQNLQHEIQYEVTRRIACMDKTSPEILKRIEGVLEKKLSMLSSGDYYAAGGIESVVEILNLVDRASERQIMEAMEDDDPELAEAIKQRMFVFEDIVMLDDRAIQKVMREVDSQDLAKAIKGARTDVQDKIFRNMSRRAADMLKEDMEYMGPVRLKDVEEAQQKIVVIIRHLEDTGEIVIGRTGEDELVDGYFEPKIGWNYILSLQFDEVERILAEVDYHTLAIALTLTSSDIFKKLTKPMGLKKRFKLKRTMRDLKNRLSVNDVADAQNKIISIAQELSSSENTKSEETAIKPAVILAGVVADTGREIVCPKS